VGWPDPLLDEWLSRLNALAVLAFWAEITRLPGHSAERSVPENATAHTMPSRFTIVAHMWLLSPLVSVWTAASRAALSCGWVGRPRQPARLPPSSAFAVEAGGASMITPIRIAGSLKEAVILIVASVS